MQYKSSTNCFVNKYVTHFNKTHIYIHTHIYHACTFMEVCVTDRPAWQRRATNMNASGAVNGRTSF